MSSSRPAFTMIEVMLAVAILGLVVAAALKLTALSQRGLSEVRTKEALMNDAMRLQVEIASAPLDLFGKSGDLQWQVTDKKEDIWFEGDIDLDALSIAGTDSSFDLNAMKGAERRWRELEVQKGGQSLKLFLPPTTEND